MENTLIDLEIWNNVDQCSHRNDVGISGLSLTDNQQSTRRKSCWYIESDRCQYYYEWNRGLSLSWEEKEKC